MAYEEDESMTEKDPTLTKYVKDVTSKLRDKLNDPKSYQKGKDKVEIKRPTIKE